MANALDVIEDGRIVELITSGFIEEQRAAIGALSDGRGSFGREPGADKADRVLYLAPGPPAADLPLSHPLAESVLGVPIVATDAGGNSEVIENGDSGVLIPVGDTEALVRALREWQAPLPGATSRFTEQQMLSATAALFESL